MTCDHPTVNGPCPRPAKGLCYYHEKLAGGLLDETGTYLSETELDQMFGGRRRNDGRRLDHYTKQ